MQHVEFGVRHGVKHHPNAGRREVVPAGVDHEATPTKPRCVFDMNFMWKRKLRFRQRSDQLRKRFHCTQGSPFGLGGDCRAGVCDVQVVTLVCGLKRGYGIFT